MPIFDSLGNIINNNDDKSLPVTESTPVEIRHDGFGNGNHSRYSAEPNTKKSDTPAPKPLPDKLKENKQ